MTEKEKEKSEPKSVKPTPKPKPVKPSRFQTFIKCVAIIGIFSAMSLTEDDKADKRKKISIWEAEKIRDELYAKVPKEINGTELTAPTSVYVKCPQSFRKNFIADAKEIGLVR